MGASGRIKNETKPLLDCVEGVLHIKGNAAELPGLSGCQHGQPLHLWPWLADCLEKKLRMSRLRVCRGPFLRTVGMGGDGSPGSQDRGLDSSHLFLF